MVTRDFQEPAKARPVAIPPSTPRMTVKNTKAPSAPGTSG